MKYVEFKELKIQNFLSVGETPVCVDFKKGLHIVTGINRDKEDRRNGVGKSTVADALYFAIFGTTLREIKKTFIPNNLTDGKTVVELSFTVNDPNYGINDFRIVRTLGPSKCIVYKNGVDKTRDTIGNTTNYIESVLSSSKEVFQNCVIMTLNNHIPFMAKSKNDKRKFIERIFNLEVFSKMVSELRGEYNGVKRDFDICATRYEETQKHLNIQENQLDNFESNKQQRIDNINSRIKIKRNDLVECEEEKDKIKKSIDTLQLEVKKEELGKTLEALYSDKEDYYMKLVELKTSIKSKQAQYGKIGTGDDICSACLRPLEDHDKDYIETEKTTIKQDISSLTDEVRGVKSSYDGTTSSIKTYNAAISKLDAKISESVQRKNSIKYINDRVVEIKQNINDYESDLLNVQNETNTFTDLVDKIQLESLDIKGEINSHKKTINMLDVVKFIVSEEGVKSFIVKKILRNFNSKLTHYLKELDSNSICVFNEYFEEEIVNEKGKICEYNSFSGAERKAIDLACLFAFMDMRKAQGDVHYNLSFYDELFDSSLDEKGVDLVLSILNNRVDKFNECVFVISHRKESIKSATGDVIFLEKLNGITKRVSFVD